MSHQKLLFAIFCLFLFNCTAATQQDPKRFSRSDWGAIDSVGLSKNHEIQFITIHHGGELFPPEKDVVQYLKNLQSWSRTAKKWADIPYHYLIAPNGDIYEGRPDSVAGDTNTSYNPSGHLLICALGNFEEIEIPEVQLASLKMLTKEKMQIHKVSLEFIKTHKDYAETACPGKNLYAFFEDGTFLKSLE